MNLVQNYYHLNPLGFKQVQVPENDLYATLPKGVYRIVVQETMQGINFYFAPAPMFSIPEHVIPDTRFIERVKNTYSLSDKQLGILLHGLSGMGKSMLAKQLCVEFIENYNMPVIVFDFKSAEYISSILEQLEQPCVILLDEFEKMFGEKTDNETSFVNQNELLSILDDTSTSKHLFLLTANRQDWISPYMFNRPSRIRYCVEFDAIPKNIINGIIDKAVTDKEKAETVKAAANSLNDLTYDILFELIKESSYTEDFDFDEILRVMNISFKVLKAKDYNISVKIDDTGLSKEIHQWLTENVTLNVLSDFNVSEAYAGVKRYKPEYYSLSAHGNIEFIIDNKDREDCEVIDLQTVWLTSEDIGKNSSVAFNNKFTFNIDFYTSLKDRAIKYFGKENLTENQIAAIQRLTFNVTFTRKQD